MTVRYRRRSRVSIISSFEERRFATKILVVGAALPHQRPHRLRVPAMGSYEERRFGIIVGKLTSALHSLTSALTVSVCP